MRQLDGITGSMDMNLSELQEIVEKREPGALQSMGLQKDGHDLGLNNSNESKSKFV